MVKFAVKALRWFIPALVAVLVGFIIFAVVTSGNARAQAPELAAKWKRDLIRQTRLEWGLDAPVATFAAQIEQESGFRPDARSPAGAIGIAQFMPATAAWIAGTYATLGPADPMNPAWALRALARYDLHLFERVTKAMNDCERMAFALSAYNGGEKFRDRGRAMCAGECDPSRWFGHVEWVHDGRDGGAWLENRGYPVRILWVREPVFVAAGWGRGMC